MCECVVSTACVPDHADRDRGTDLLHRRRRVRWHAGDVCPDRDGTGQCHVDNCHSEHHDQHHEGDHHHHNTTVRSAAVPERALDHNDELPGGGPALDALEWDRVGLQALSEAHDRCVLHHVDAARRYARLPGPGHDGERV